MSMKWEAGHPLAWIDSVYSILRGQLSVFAHPTETFLFSLFLAGGHCNLTVEWEMILIFLTIPL
jgi:hypothetical protein